MQSNWIGKSIGAEIDFNLSGSSKKIKVFTTRPDTIYGATFLALSPEHTISIELSKKNLEAKNFVEQCKNTNSDKTKLGFKTDLFADHPFIKNKKIPVFIANFVLTEYGLGSILGALHTIKEIWILQKNMV